MNKNKLKEKALEILKLKKRMDALDKKYNKIETFLLQNLKVGEDIKTSIGNVNHSTLTRRFVNAELFYKKVDLNTFLDSINIKVSKAEKVLGSDNLEKISECSTYDKLCVNLKKIPIKQV